MTKYLCTDGAHSTKQRHVGQRCCQPCPTCGARIVRPFLELHLREAHPVQPLPRRAETHSERARRH